MMTGLHTVLRPVEQILVFFPKGYINDNVVMSLDNYQ